MINFLLKTHQLFNILLVLTKNQLLTHSDKIKLPFKLRITGRILQLTLSPTGLFKTPTESFGERLTKGLEQLGPIYIKFGQTLSTRPDLIGDEVAESLKYLQDKLPPYDTEIAKQIIYSSFGKTDKELFNYFEDTPVAAASISQVHKAELKTGEIVAVKILRPGIHKEYQKDINLLYFLAKFMPKFLKRVKRFKIKELIDVFQTTMKCELDLKLEAAAAAQMLDNAKNDFDVHIPKVYWDLTSKDVLTTEWVDGISIYDKKALISSGLNPADISKKIAVLFFNQAYRDGFFHADLHPGNILIRHDGSIALLDFGIIGRLSEKDRLAVAEIIFSFIQKDYKEVAKIHLKAEYIPKTTNLELFAQSCRAATEGIIGAPAKEASISKLLTQLFQVIEDFNMEIQPQLLLLQKTLVVVEGIGRSLDDEINMWKLAEPWIKKWAAKNISPEAKILRLIKQMFSEFLERAL